MQRRAFIAGLGGAAVAWPLAARAQQSSRMKRIAIVSPATKIGDMGVNGSPFYRVFFEELSRLGYIEGQNYVIEYRSADGDAEPETLTSIGILWPAHVCSTSSTPCHTAAKA